MKLPQRQPKRPTGRQRPLRDTPAPPPAFSYRAQRSQRPDAVGRQQTATQQRSQKLSLQYWLRRSGFILVMAVGLICAVSIVSLSTTPRIEIAGQPAVSDFRSTEIYQHAISRDLASSIWNRNKITVDSGGVSRQLQQQFPELAQVTVALPLVGHKPIFYLTTNPPAFVFQSASGTYVLDSAGTVLAAKAMLASKVTAKLPVLTDQTGLRVTTGQRVISALNANFIMTVLANLQAKQVQIASLVLPASTAQELDVHITGQAYYIKFNMHDSSGAQQQAGTYLATIQNLSTQHIVPGQYIDVRVPGRAYYQ